MRNSSGSRNSGPTACGTYPFHGGANTSPNDLCGGGAHEGRLPAGKSPSPLSPSPPLSCFGPQSGGLHGPTPSFPSQANVGFGGQGSSSPSAMADAYRQRSPTMMLPAESAASHNTNHRAPPSGGPRALPEGRRSPLAAQYMPPPPMRVPGAPVRHNVFDDDDCVWRTMVAGARGGGTPSPAHPNSTVSGSVSPLSEGRFGYLAHHKRPVSAMTVCHSPLYGRAFPPTPASGAREDGGGAYRSAAPLQRAASSINYTKPLRPKITLWSNCGAIVDHVDPKTACLIAQYRCGWRLGSGGYAEVFEFTDLATKESFACKVIDKAKLGSHGEEKVRLEVEMHKRMNHPNIVRMYKMFSDDYYFFIILELCNDKNLMDVCNERKALPVAEVRLIMRQLTSAVEYMHSKKVLHRDIKLGNIMIDLSGNVKIGDFGFANELAKPHERKSRLCGTPNYIAPEILAFNETRVGYGFEVDIWSLGVLLFILAFGYPPFESRDVPSTYDRIRAINYRFPSSDSRKGTGVAQSEEVPQSCKDLIASMLRRDPSKRPTPREILESPFLRGSAASTTMASPAMALPSSATARVGTHDGRAAADCGPQRQNEQWQQHHHQCHVSPHGFTPLQQQHDGSRLIVGGAGGPAPARRERHFGSPFMASPISAHSPFACERGRGDLSPLAATSSSPSPRPIEAARCNAALDDTGLVSDGHLDARAQELFPSSTSAKNAQRPEGPCRTLHHFLQDDDMGVGLQAARIALPRADRACGCHRQPDCGEQPLGEKLLPPAPLVYLRNAMFTARYGYAFTLHDCCCDKGKVALFFNDRTKLVYDELADTVHYVSRVRATGGADGAQGGAANESQRRTAPAADADGGRVRRSPSNVMGAEASQVSQGMDVPQIYIHARQTLQPGGGARADRDGKGPVYLSAAEKKFGIASFLAPFLSGDRADAMYPVARSSLKHLHREACRASLFCDRDREDAAAASTGPEPPGTTLAYVKQAYMGNLMDLNKGVTGVDALLTAARFSDESCQLTVMFSSPCPVSLIPTTESHVVPREARWRFDVLVYLPFHCVIGIETEHSRFYQSVYDLRRDVRTTEEGKVFRAAGSTSNMHHEFMIPEQLLDILVELLTAVKAVEKVLNFFRYHK